MFALCSPFQYTGFVNWATVTVTDIRGNRYSIDVEAESTYDAALPVSRTDQRARDQRTAPIPSLETIFEVTVNGKVHKVSGAKLQRWIINDEKNGKDHGDYSSNNDPILGP